MLKIDPTTGLVSTFGGTVSGWHGFTLGPDGLVYATLYAGTERYVDPTLDTSATYLVPYPIDSVNTTWEGIVLAPNGCLYMIPRTTINSQLAQVVRLGVSLLNPLPLDFCLSRYINKY